jgi:hypothetical protein
MNRESITTVVVWIIIIISGLWFAGVFGDNSTKTQSYQNSTPVYSIPTSTTNSPSLEVTPVNDFENNIFIPPTFHGYICTEDCSGHEAGYEWAEEHDITDPDDCGGNSQSFIEGCQAYAEENSDDGDSF